MNIFIKYIIITTISCLYVELIGYLAHRYIIHQGILGDNIRITHYCHHEKKYPHHDFDSDKYRTAHDTWPWILIIIIFAYLPNWSLYKLDIYGKYVMVYLLFLMSLHLVVISYIHDSYHIKNHWLNKYNWYKNHKKYHHIHHLDDKNYGITNYFYDHLFNTFSDKIVPKKNNFNGFESKCENRIKWLDFLSNWHFI